MTNNKHTLKWISAVAGKKKIMILALLVIQAVLGITGVLYALILRKMIDAAVSADLNGFTYWVIVFVGTVALQLVVRAVGRFAEEYTRSSLENRYKEKLFADLLNKEYSDVSRIHSGEWLNRLTSDTVVVSDGMTQIVPGVTGMIVRLFGALAAILVLVPMFGWFIIPGGLLLLLLSYMFRKVLKKLHKQVQEKDGRLRIFFQDYLGSLLMVKTFGVEKRVNSDAIDKMNEHKKARLKRNHFSNVCNIGFGAIMNGAYAIGAICCCYGIINGTMTYGTLMAILQLIGQIQSPFAGITGYLPRYYSMLASAERLMDAENLNDTEMQQPVSSADIDEFYNEKYTAIGLKNVSFTYLPPSVSLDSDTQVERRKINMPVVLSNISLEIKKGEFVAFTGTTGCGKSTLLKLFMCLYAIDEGSRYILCKDGVMPLTGRWRGLFAYVPQGNYLMSGSIRDIVCFSDMEAANDDVRIKSALRISCVDEFVYNLKDGIDTVLGERGLGLSEGQMQRIAIARAIFSDNPILMLDESTSALDESTENRLLNNLKQMTDKTVLIVTHRMSVLSICDKVVEFGDDGIGICNTTH